MPANTKTGQLRLLLWKNWLLQKKKIKLTIAEIVFPALFAVLLFLLRRVIVPVPEPDATHWQSFSVDEPQVFMKLWYAPDNPVVKRMMSKVTQRLNIESDSSYATEEDLLKHLKVIETSEVIGAVVFTNDFPSDEGLPLKVSYKIRLQSDHARDGYINWQTQYTVPESTIAGPRANDSSRGGWPGYDQYGFLAIQQALDLAITQEFNDSAAVDDVTVRLKRHPYPPYVADGFIIIIQRSLPIFVMLSFMILAPNICKEVVLEKEHKLKEFMKMMGLGNWQHWLAWFIKYVIFGIFTVTIIVFFLFLGAGDGAPSHSDATLVFVFLLLYCVTTILFCFAIAACFSKANSASTAGGILFFINYAPFFYLAGIYSDMETWMKMGTSLFHNIAMAYGCHLIGIYEGRGTGLKWSNLHTSVIPSDGFTMLHVLLMLLVDCLIYGTVAWYVEAVRPGPYGQPQPWTFPFRKWYWCGETSGGADEAVSEEEALIDHGSRANLFEPNPTNEKTGIKIRNLKKVYKKGGKKVVAVDGMSLDMLEGQITALLGHNGAGKTTTMHMITGFLPSSKGSIIVNGNNVKTSLDKVRSSLGLCPQLNILFDKLTVAQHLDFFGQLKGIPKSEIDGQVNDLIKTLDLEQKANAESMSLSGGMKRKLCLGIALIGGPEVLILDEPTSGMDPENRRKMWDILQSQREGRTMVLSTHMMDEADFLGDRIAIMAQGQAQCCGTSLFLKGKYGVGYHMVIVKQAKCAVDQLTSLITSFVPEATLESNVGAELSYLLPKESSHEFEKLFTQLETEREKLGIDSFGASVTTMEEVFLKVGASVDKSLAQKLQNSGDPSKPEEDGDAEENNQEATTIMKGDESVPQKNTGILKYVQQYRAMVVKRLLHTWRNAKITTSQILVPVLFTVWACTTFNSIATRGNSPALKLTLSPYDHPVVPYATNGTTAAKFAEVYAGLMRTHGRGGVPHINDDDNYEDKPDMEEYLVDVAEHDLLEYITNQMIAASFSTEGDSDKVTILAYFNNEGFHTPAITLTYVGNVILQYFTDDHHHIEATNHPLPRVVEEQAQDEIMMSDVRGSVMAYNLCFGLSFLAASFVLFLIKERVSGSKHMQYVSQGRSSVYWAATFSWDMVNFLIPVILIIGVFAIFDIKPYYQGTSAGYTFLTFLIYGCAILPFVYLLSYLFKVPSSGYNWVSSISIFSAIAALIAVGILKIFDSTREQGKIVEWVGYLILPNFCFMTAMQNIYANNVVRGACDDMAADLSMTLEQSCRLSKMRNITNPCCKDLCGDHCAGYQDDYLAWEQPGIGRNVMCMILQCLIYFLLVLLMDSGLWRIIKQAIATWLGRRRQNAGPPAGDGMTLMERPTSPEDSAVQEERERIASTPHDKLLKTDSLLLHSLKKYYGYKLAVDEVSVGIPQGECFGLLGVNGAGKTTTFKMLTGEETLSAGDAWLDGYSVKSQIKEAQQRMGYCPQFDALIDQMSVKETLTMYARIRGVTEDDIVKVVDLHIKKLVLEEHVDKLTAKLSGGNKRKLSTAIALIGDPPIVFLDEPTTGVDPVARRLIWDMLASVRASGRTLVLTTHSMEECEALCTRLAIMVNGQFKCLGSTQALKSKFGEGYTVMVRLQPGQYVDMRMTELMNMFNATFPGCIVKDLHQGFVHYHIPATTQTWAGIFGTLERAKQEYNIEDYSVSQTTLEQVFLGFARAQVQPIVYNPSCVTIIQRCCSRSPNSQPQAVPV